MRVLLFTLGLLAGSRYGQAQNNIPYNPDLTFNKAPVPASANTREQFNRERAEEARRRGSRQPNSATNIYLLSYWTRGLLRPYTGPPSQPWLKYDVVNSRLLSRSATGDTAVVNTDVLREFALGDSLLGTHRTYRRYLNARVESPGLRTTFFEVRYDAGRAALLCRQLYSLRAADEPAKGHSRRQPPTKPVTAYYLKNASGVLAPVLLAAEPILAAVEPAHRAALAAYITNQGLKLIREADLVKLLVYYDTL